MAKIKHTKNELKAQREALARFERYLPMLLLKKQQLQAEILAVTQRIIETQAEEDRLRAELARWVKVLSEPIPIEGLVALESKEIEEGNIAGVRIPILKDVKIARRDPDLFATPPWVDDAARMLEQLIRLQAERETLEEQRDLITEELRVTAQRVNLFEKVKIPECRENIRTIQIFLGDEQTASVARGKLAKKRAVAA